MSVGVLYDPNESKAALYDSVSETAFGPLFDDGEGTSARDEAEDFLAWVRDSGRPWWTFHRSMEKGEQPMRIKDDTAYEVEEDDE